MFSLSQTNYNHMLLPVFYSILTIFLIAAFFPGYMSTDSLLQLLEARDGIYSDWHPPFMSFLWRYIDKVIPGPLGMLLLSVSMVIAGSLAISRYWFLGRGAALFSWFVPLMLLFPPIFSVLGVVWKDILMLGALMIAIGYSRARTKASLWVFIFFAALSILFRLNSIFAVIPLCMLRIYETAPASCWVSWARVCVLGCFLGLAIFSAMSFVSGRLVSYQTGPWASIAIFDISGVIAGVEDGAARLAIYEKVPSILHGKGGVNAVVQDYTPTYWQEMFFKPSSGFQGRIDGANKTLRRFSVAFMLTSAEKEQLLKAWWNAVYDHPSVWFKHRVEVFKYVVGWGGVNLWSPVFMTRLGARSNLIEEYGKMDEANLFQKRIFWRLDALSKNTPLFRPYIYLFLTLGMLGLAVFLRGGGKAEIAVFFLLSSGLAHESALFFLAPSGDYRYSHYMVYTTVLSVLVLFFIGLDRWAERRGCHPTCKS